MDILLGGSDHILETCWGIATVSGVAGAGAGYGFGIFIATLQGGHGDLADAPMKEQLKQGFKRTFRMALQRGSYFAKQFGAVGLVYAYIECTLSKALGKHDFYNALIAAAMGGSMFALVPTLPHIRSAVPSSVARGMMMGAVGWTAFTFVMELGLRSLFFATSYDAAYAKGGTPGQLWHVTPTAVAAGAAAEVEDAEAAAGWSGAPTTGRVSVDPPRPTTPSLWYRLLHGSHASTNRASALDGDGWVSKPF